MKIIIKIFSVILLINAIGNNISKGQMSDFVLSYDSTYFPAELCEREYIDTGIFFIDSLHYASSYLHLFNEPVLYPIDSTVKIFRFTWLRSFHPPVVISLIRHRNQTWLQTKYGIPYHQSYEDIIRLEKNLRKKYLKKPGASGYLLDTFNQVAYDNFTLNFRYFILEKKLPSISFNEFISFAEDAFWHIPSMKRLEPVNDGAVWLLEGYTPGNGYHLVNCWSPDKNRNYQFRQLCELLIDWTGIFRKRFIY